MLSQLTVRNLAIVEEVSVPWGKGLNIITGETGAGKSVLMGALHLVLGGRADKSAIRDGEKEAFVEAAFQVENNAAIDSFLEETGLPACEEKTLLVRRIVSQSGSGRCWINDSTATINSLRQLGDLLVDIHGPYDHQSLLNNDFQRDLLDDYGNCGALRDDYLLTWEDLQSVKERLHSLQGDSEDVAVEIDRLQFAVDEITQASLTDADEEDLVAHHAQAANAEQIMALGSDTLHLLTDGEQTIFDQLVTVQNNLAELSRILPGASSWRTEAQNAAMQIQELSTAISEKLSRMELDPERLAQLEERMSLVQRLKRKYGHTVQDILATLKKSEERLRDLSARTEQIEKLQKEIDALQQELPAKGKVLTQKRIKEATRLSRSITAELRDLGFLHSGFDISVLPCEPAASGCDKIEFGFAPNPGEPMRALKSIASSGEIARVMLAVKAVLSAHDKIPILVFDEIDANIGGEVGRAVGMKLRKVAQNHQVLCITHLPQSAVYGERHYRVGKSVSDGRTRTHIRLLDQQGRIDEIARMLGGKGSSSVVEEHAKELLASATVIPPQRKERLRA